MHKPGGCFEFPAKLAHLVLIGQEVWGELRKEGQFGA